MPDFPLNLGYGNLPEALTQFCSGGLGDGIPRGDLAPALLLAGLSPAGHKAYK